MSFADCPLLGEWTCNSSRNVCPRSSCSSNRKLNSICNACFVAYAPGTPGSPGNIPLRAAAAKAIPMSASTKIRMMSITTARTAMTIAFSHPTPKKCLISNSMTIISIIVHSQPRPLRKYPRMSVRIMAATTVKMPCQYVALGALSAFAANQTKIPPMIPATMR